MKSPAIHAKTLTIQESTPPPQHSTTPPRTNMKNSPQSTAAHDTVAPTTEHPGPSEAPVPAPPVASAQPRPLLRAADLIRLFGPPPHYDQLATALRRAGFRPTRVEKEKHDPVWHVRCSIIDNKRLTKPERLREEFHEILDEAGLHTSPDELLIHIRHDRMAVTFVNAIGRSGMASCVDDGGDGPATGTGTRQE